MNAQITITERATDLLSAYPQHITDDELVGCLQYMATTDKSYNELRHFLQIQLNGLNFKKDADCQLGGLLLLVLNMAGAWLKREEVMNGKEVLP